MLGKPLNETNHFYRKRGGFSYDKDKVVSWLRRFAHLPKKGKVLDLCCGDGIWAWGMLQLHPELEVFGVDISAGGIGVARDTLGRTAEFQCRDVEQPLDFPGDTFDLIFARGLPFFNQHDMNRPAFIALLEHWHTLLKKDGRFFSTYSSRPELMGSYTDPKNTKLPLNRKARKTPAIEFSGGKYHHSVSASLQPFWSAQNVAIKKYSFISTRHILTTARDDGVATN